MITILIYIVQQTLQIIWLVLSIRKNMSSRHIVVLDRGTLMPLPWAFDFEHHLTEHDDTPDNEAINRCRDDGTTFINTHFWFYSFD